MMAKHGQKSDAGDKWWLLVYKWQKEHKTLQHNFIDVHPEEFFEYCSKCGKSNRWIEHCYVTIYLCFGLD